MTEGEWQHAVTRKLEDIEGRLTTIEATKGTVKIPLGAWLTMVGILLTLIASATGAAYMSGQFSATLAAQTYHITLLSDRVHEHEVLKGHAGVSERLDAIKDEVDKLERKQR